MERNLICIFNLSENKNIRVDYNVAIILQAVIDEKPDMVWIQDKSGKIIFYNKAFCSFFNIVKNDDIYKILTPGIINTLTFEEGQNSTATKIVRINEKEIKIEKVKYSLHGFEGYINCGSIFEKSNSSYSDSAYLNALLENIPYQIYFKDTKSRFTLINHAQAKMLGLKNSENAIGKTDFDFFTYDHAKDAYDDEQKILKSGNPLILKTERVRNADGSFAWMNTTKVAIKDKNGKPVGIVGISYDITEKIITDNQLKKAKEKAEESDHLKTAFLANMSHEIRTPMNGIIGFINLLKVPDITEEERIEFFNHIESCTHTLLNLIDDIIDISKIESGQLSISKTKTDIEEVVLDLIRTFKETIKTVYNKPVELILNIPDNEVKIIAYTDHYRLRQILSNLLNNAYKYTNQGYVELGFKPNSEFIEFYVKDTGIGIPNDKKEIIFERFGQANQSIYLSNKGTGLGLSISKNLVHKLGGEIWFESVENKGSTFYFTLPLDDLKKNESEKVLISHNKLYQWKNKTMLIIGSFHDDEKKIKDYLYKTDINILWAESNKKALKLYLEHSQLNIILLECYNDLVSSKNILHQLTQSKNEIPILAVMTTTTYSEYNNLKDEGCTNLIIKPIEKQIFLDIIDKYIL